MRGKSRNPWAVWLLAVATCGVYAFYWWYAVGHELADHLGRRDVHPDRDVLFAVLTCGMYTYNLALEYGALIEEGKARAGVPLPEDPRPRFLGHLLLCGLGHVTMQRELNELWAAVDRASHGT